MNNFLIITNTDMSLQSGNVVLINRRAQEFFKQFNIRTTCIVVKRNFKKCIKHNIEGINYIISCNKKEIGDYIIHNNPQKIIFYGIGSYFYINYIKNLKKK